MGIRYYGWAVTSDEVIEAMDDPWPVIRRADQRHDIPGWTNTDFDKAWWRMQQLFSPDWPRTRPAYDLVAGNVTYPHGYDKGYLPHVGVLAPDRVPEIARDLATVRREDVRELCEQLCYGDAEERASDEDYVSYYLTEARNFVDDAAARGHGIVYAIT